MRGTRTSFIQLEAMLRMGTLLRCQRLRNESPPTPLLDILSRNTHKSAYAFRGPRSDCSRGGWHAFFHGNSNGASARCPRDFAHCRLLRECCTPWRLPPVRLSPLLSSEDLHILMVGRCFLMDGVFNQAWQWLIEDGFKNSCGKYFCRTTRIEIMRATVKDSHRAVDLFLHPMPHEKAKIRVVSEDELSSIGKMCGQCFSSWQQAEKSGYSGLWEIMPTYFGFAP